MMIGVAHVIGTKPTLSLVFSSCPIDSFNAALAYGYLEGWPMGEAARLANAVGAVKATKMGAGRGVPTREEIDAFLSKHGLAFEGFGTP